MAHTLRALLDDETGFIVSAELVLIATITVIGVIVGLAEVQNAVVNELNDIGEAIGSLNQSFFVHGHKSFSFCGHALKAQTFGSQFTDHIDEGDRNECSISCFTPVPEMPKGHGGMGGGGMGGGGFF